MSFDLRDKLFTARVALLKEEGKKHIVKRNTWNVGNWPTFNRVLTKYFQEEGDEKFQLETEEDLEFLLDDGEVEKLLGFIQGTKYKNSKGETFSNCQKITHTAQIASVISALSKNVEFEPIWKKFSSAASEMRGVQKTKDSKNELSAKEEEHLKAWNIYEQAFSKIDIAEFPKAKCVVGLFTLIDPRRSSLLKLYLGPLKNDKEGENQNELLLNKKKIFLRNYKTSKFYGEQTIELPQKLVRCLRSYVKQFDIRKGEPVFYTSNHSNLLKQSFKKAGLPHVTANLLRHSRISEMYQNNTSVYDKEQLAKSMGHSIGVQSFYNKIKKNSSEEEKKEE